MFAEYFQSGAVGVEVLTPAGKNPPSRLFKINGPPGLITKEYEREIKGFKYELKGKGSQTSSIQCPSEGKDSLALTQPLIVFQLRSAYQDDPMNLEIVVIDTKCQRRRFLFSTTFRSMELNSLHAQVPWTQPRRDVWTNVVFDLQQLTQQCFSSNFASVDSFVIRPVCFLRKIFTLPLAAIQSSIGDGLGDVAVPSNFDFPLGSMFTTFQFTLKKLSSKIGKESPSSFVLATGLQVSGSKIQSQKVSNTLQKDSRSPVRSGSAGSKGHLLSKLISRDVNNESHTMMKSEMLLSAGVRSISAGVNRAAPTSKLTTDTKALRSKSLGNINDRNSSRLVRTRTLEENMIRDSQVDELSKLLYASLEGNIEEQMYDESPVVLVSDYSMHPEQLVIQSSPPLSSPPPPSSTSTRPSHRAEKNRKVSYKDEVEVEVELQGLANSKIDAISAKQLSHLITQTTSTSNSNSRPITITGNRLHLASDNDNEVKSTHLNSDDTVQTVQNVQNVRISNPNITIGIQKENRRSSDDNILLKNIPQLQVFSETKVEEHSRPITSDPILHHNHISINSAESQILLLRQDENRDGVADNNDENNDENSHDREARGGAKYLTHHEVVEGEIGRMENKTADVQERKERKKTKELEERKGMRIKGANDEINIADEVCDYDYDENENTIPISIFSWAGHQHQSTGVGRGNVYDRGNLNSDSTEVSGHGSNIFLSGSMENIRNDDVLHGSLSRASTSSLKSDFDDDKNENENESRNGRDYKKQLDRSGTGRTKWRDEEDNIIGYASGLSSPTRYYAQHVSDNNDVFNDVLGKGKAITIKKDNVAKRRYRERETERSEGFYEDEDDSTIDLLAQLSNGFESEISSSFSYLSPNAPTPVRGMNSISIHRMTSPQAVKNLNSNLKKEKEKDRCTESSSSSSSFSGKFSKQLLLEVESPFTSNKRQSKSSSSAAIAVAAIVADVRAASTESSCMSLETRKMLSHTDSTETEESVDEDEDDDEGEEEDDDDDERSDSENESGSERGYDERDEEDEREGEKEENVFTASSSSPLLAVLTNQLNSVLSVLMHKEYSYIEEFGEDSYTAIR